MTLSPSERARKLVGRDADPPEDRLQAMVRFAYRDGPSVSLDPTAGPGLPEGVPPLPQVRWTTEELAAAHAAVAELTAEVESFEGRLAAAYEAGDPDEVLAARRDREELSVRLWAARRKAVAVEQALVEGEADRVVGSTQVYASLLDAARVEVREAQARERALFEANTYVESVLGRLANAAERLGREQAELAKGPADLGAVAPRRREGWRS